VNSQQFGTALNDASKRKTQVDKQHLPHLSDPLIVTTAKANHLSITGQSYVDAIGDSLHLATGSDHVSQQGGHHLRHTGQALSVLSGVIKPGTNNLGLQTIAANDPLTIQAQADTIRVIAQQALQLSSQQGNVTLASPKAIHLKTEAGARLSLINGNIEVHAPGTMTLKRAVSKQVAGGRIEYSLVPFPHNMMNFNDRFQLLDPAGDPIANMQCEITKEDGSKLMGVTDSSGHLALIPGVSPTKLQIKVVGKVRT
jgi:type VI secretion system secreted protein VgrG